MLIQVKAKVPESRNKRPDQEIRSGLFIFSVVFGTIFLVFMKLRLHAVRLYG